MIDTVTLRTQLSFATFMLGGCKPPAPSCSVGLFIGASVIRDSLFIEMRGWGAVCRVVSDLSVSNFRSPNNCAPCSFPEGGSPCLYCFHASLTPNDIKVYSAGVSEVPWITMQFQLTCVQANPITCDWRCKRPRTLNCFELPNSHGDPVAVLDEYQLIGANFSALSSFATLP